MRPQRNENPVADTEREDREISKMEKLLGLKKMKKLPTTFESEGLTCIHRYEGPKGMGGGEGGGGGGSESRGCGCFNPKQLYSVTLVRPPGCTRQG